MKITQAVRARAQQILLSFEDAPDALVDARTFEESPYGVGSSLSEQEWEQLCRTSQQNRLRERALYLLSGRSYSKKELLRKLERPRKGPAPDAQQALQTAERMEQIGLIDDASYAMRLARDMQQYRHYPRRRIAAELATKGIDRMLIQDAVDALPEEDGEIALALLQKRYYNKLSTEQDRKKTADALLRRGFSYQDIRTAMQRCGNPLQQTEETWL